MEIRAGADVDAVAEVSLVEHRAGVADLLNETKSNQVDLRARKDFSYSSVLITGGFG